jgi:hypothetical protein
MIANEKKKTGQALTRLLLHIDKLKSLLYSIDNIIKRFIFPIVIISQIEFYRIPVKVRHKKTSINRRVRSPNLIKL